MDWTKTVSALLCVVGALAAGGGSAFASPARSGASQRTPSAAALSPADEATLQQTLEAAQRQGGSPGASAAIVQDGQLLWSGDSGEAISESAVPVGPDTLFSLASVSKMYTATMIMKLVEAGQLGLDQPIAGLVPSYIPDTGEVTVRDLLDMTSGYADVEESDRFIHWSHNPNYPWTQEALFHLIKPLRRRPGTKYSYNNTNFLLLDRIIEDVAKVNYATELEQTILDPLELRHTFVTLSPTVVENFAHGYILRRGGGLRDYFEGASAGVPTDVFGPIWGDGGIAANAADVATFFDALYGGRILAPSTIAEMEQPQSGGSPGIATEPKDAQGVDWQGHSGGYGGFSTEAWYDSARGLTVVALTNELPGNVNKYAGHVVWDRVVRAYDGLTGTEARLGRH